MTDPDPAFHLLLDPDETGVTASALRLLVVDATHQPVIRRLAREVLARLDGGGTSSVCCPCRSRRPR